jgi:hypothetical protein
MNATDGSMMGRWLLGWLMASSGIALPAAAFQAGEPARTAPPVRVAMMSTYQHWSDRGADLYEASVPLTAQILVRPNLGARLGIGQVFAGGDAYPRISGWTDLTFAFDYHLPLNQAEFVIDLDFNLPTGQRHLSDEAYATAFRLGLRQFDFHMPPLTEGSHVTPGISFVKAIAPHHVLSFGGAYRFRGSFEPIAGLLEAYDPGNEFLFTFGASGKMGRAQLYSADLLIVRYAADRVGPITVYRPGRQLTLQLQLHRNVRQHKLQLGMLYRTTGENRVRAGAEFLPELRRAYPDLIRLTGQFRVTWSPVLCTLLQLERTQYKADHTFDRVYIVGFGILPEFAITPAVTALLQARYTAGDFRGGEVGAGIVLVL